MRIASVSMPLSSTQALNADNVGPAVRTKGKTLPMMKSCEPTTAPPSTRPCPSICLVAEWTTMSAPNFIGCCNAGEQKQLSTTSSAPALWAMSATAAMSATSVSGFEGVSRKNSLVFGLTAARQAARSVPSTKVVSTPNLAKMLENSVMVEPKMARELTRWSPACIDDITIDMIALIPDAVAMHASAPSSAARRLWNIATVGLVKREYVKPDSELAKRSAASAALLKQKLEVRYIASECSMNSLRMVPARTPSVSMPRESRGSGSFMMGEAVVPARLSV